MKKHFIIASHTNTWRKWLFWIGDFAQIYHDLKNDWHFGYYDAWKEDGILEDGVFIKAFIFGRTVICWCDGEIYRKKHNISYDWEEEENE